MSSPLLYNSMLSNITKIKKQYVVIIQKISIYIKTVFAHTSTGRTEKRGKTKCNNLDKKMHYFYHGEISNYY